MTVLWLHFVLPSIFVACAGIVKPGQMCAILGSSGAGKSSFMNIIAKRANGGTIGGLSGVYSEGGRFRVAHRSHVVRYCPV